MAIAAIAPDTPVGVIAHIYLADAELHGALGQYTRSCASAQRALQVLNPLEHPTLAARAKQTAGGALAALGQGAEGEALLDEALTAAASLGNERLRALALGDLGTAHSRRGDVGAARAFYAEALGLYTSRGLQRPAASIAGHLAEVEFAAGNPGAALQRAKEAKAGHESSKNRRSVANDLCNMAAYLIALGRFDEARVQAERALLAACDINASVLTAFTLQHVAAVAALCPSHNEDELRTNGERAARLLGFVDARVAALGARREFTEEQEYRAVLGALSAGFAASELETLLLQGRAWSEEIAVGWGLESLRE